MDLLDIKPHVVSKNLKGYSVMFYGDPKSGKTTIATRFPNHLLLATEKGYSAIPGAMAKPINSWLELKRVLKELKDPDVQARFETIVLDTADIAFAMCEQYVCNVNGVSNIKDIPFGAGYKQVETQFDEFLRAIVSMDYGLVIISHSVDKVFTDEQGLEYNQIIPTLPNKARIICSRLCDIIGYSRSVETPEGLVTKLFLRGTPRFVAGSRFKYIEPVIDFNYQALVDAIGNAVDKEAAELNDASLFTTQKAENPYKEDEVVLDFDDIVKQFNEKVQKLIEEDEEYFAPRIVEIVESYLGAGQKVAGCTRAQVGLVDAILADVKQLY